MITFPIDPASRWCSYNTQTGQIEGGRRKKWPADPSGPPVGQDAKYVLLREVEAEQPPYDPQTHTLRRVEAPVIDVQANTATTVWELVERPVADQVASIEAESARRIDAKLGSTRSQLRRLMKGSLLTNKQAKGGKLTVQEKAMEDALLSDAALVEQIVAHEAALIAAAEAGTPYDITAPWPGD